MLLADVASRSFSFCVKSRSISRDRIETERFYGLFGSLVIPQRLWLYDVPSSRWQCDILSSCFSFYLFPAFPYWSAFFYDHIPQAIKKCYSRGSWRKLAVSTNRSCNGDEICDSLHVDKNSESIRISERGKNFWQGKRAFFRNNVFQE